MSKSNIKFTEDQVKRLRYAIKNRNWIPKDIRKKLYRCVKINLKIKDGITDSLLNEINKLVSIVSFNYDILSICFPSTEISLDAYWNFMGEDPEYDYDENKFDEFNVQGYKNRVLYLQYLIDKI